MDENIFSEEQLDELTEQGFTEADIYFLETLDINHDILYDNIMRDIIDGLSSEEIMYEYRRHNPNRNPNRNRNRNRNRNHTLLNILSSLLQSSKIFAKGIKSKRNNSKRNKSKRNKTKRNK
jgi:hypothetical protein